MNDNGQVVGDDAYNPAIYSGGTSTSLGSLPGGSGGESYGINAIGQVVGGAFTSSGDTHAFLYSNGTMTDLGVLPGDRGSEALAINASGVVVGVSAPGTAEDNGFDGDISNAFVYANGTMTDLGAPLGGSGYNCYAGGVNASGQVVGGSSTSAGGYHAFLYSAGTVSDLGSLYEGTLGQSQANAINDVGQVVGDSQANSTYFHAFLYSQGTMADLGTLPGWNASYGDAINDLGQVVGGCGDAVAGDQPGAAFVYTGGEMLDLSSLVVNPMAGLTLMAGEAINDSGQIAVYAVNADGGGQGVLLTPVPEPSTVILIGIGTMGLVGYGWRRHKSPTR
jgi:probable HAF family extracellular repeat protein